MTVMTAPAAPAAYSVTARTLHWITAMLVLAHIGAALFHHFVRKDRVLMRMITG